MTYGRVLIFGDSLSNAGPTVVELQPGATLKGSPGARLGQLLLNNGKATAVRINAKVSRSASNFYSREDHAALLAADRAWRPTTVIFWLGTNDIGLNMATDGARMKALRDALPANTVVTFGPPAFPGVARLEQGSPAVYQMLRSFGDVVDVRPLTPRTGRSGDGVHFAPEGARLMSEALYAEMKRPGNGYLGAPAGGTPLLAWGLILALGGLAYWRLFR